MKKALLVSLILMFCAGIVLTSARKKGHTAEPLITSAAYYKCNTACIITRVPQQAGKPHNHGGIYYRYPVKAFVFARKLLNTY
jgi:hypothetical protein